MLALVVRHRRRWLHLHARALGDDGGGDGRADRLRVARWYRALELDPGASRDLVRRQYVALVKRFHPDAPGGGDPGRFQLVDEAYRGLTERFREHRRREEDAAGEFGLYYDEAKRRRKGEDGEEPYEHPDIRHTAPQHRQYLSHEGFGYGTPGQRQRQYQKYRAARASESVHEHKVEKLTAKYETRLEHMDKKRSKRHKSRGVIERVVEDLIAESMAKGEFQDLKGTGKPLPDRTRYNPYMDFTSHKMNEILAEGGFAPEWIMLKKDIRAAQARIRASLSKTRASLSPAAAPPLPPAEAARWESAKARLEAGEVKELNRTIDKFNLVVPSMREQMFHFSLERESDKILRENPLGGAAKQEGQQRQPPEPKPGGDGRRGEEGGLLAALMEGLKELLGGGKGKT